MKKISIIIVFIYCIVITILYINTNHNLKLSNNNLEETNKKINILSNKEAPPTTYTFYAQIEDIDLDNNEIMVKGLKFDTIYNKKYLLKISDETLIIGNGNTSGSNILTLSDFNNNQYIAITYCGVITNSTNYDIIEDITKVQLLEDKNK